MLIEVTIRNAYGQGRIYPANDAARTLAKIAGTTTLSLVNLKDAVKLGHGVICEGPHSPLADEVNACNRAAETAEREAPYCSGYDA